MGVQQVQDLVACDITVHSSQFRVDTYPKLPVQPKVDGSSSSPPIGQDLESCFGLVPAALRRSIPVQVHVRLVELVGPRHRHLLSEVVDGARLQRVRQSSYVCELFNILDGHTLVRQVLGDPVGYARDAVCHIGLHEGLLLDLLAPRQLVKHFVRIVGGHVVQWTAQRFDTIVRNVCGLRFHHDIFAEVGDLFHVRQPTALTYFGEATLHDLGQVVTTVHEHAARHVSSRLTCPLVRSRATGEALGTPRIMRQACARHRRLAA